MAKGYAANWSKEVFVISRIKNTVPWTYVIMDLNGEEIIQTFYEKELQRINQEEFRIEKVIKRKEISYIRKNIFACLFSVHYTISLSRHEQVCLNGKAMIVYLMVGLIKKTLYKMESILF